MLGSLMECKKDCEKGATIGVIGGWFCEVIQRAYSHMGRFAATQPECMRWIMRL